MHPPEIPFDMLRSFIRNILEMPYAYQWSVQGFGMMRTYLDPDKRFRLNIWDGALGVPNVSTVHDHPWDFDSWIISGTFANRQYFEQPEGTGGIRFKWMTIKTGEGGGPDGSEGQVSLSYAPPTWYHAGDQYSQMAEEIHETLFVDGSVTINDRRRREDGEHARVFWPARCEWVDAEPRQATPREVVDVTKRALSLMKSEM